MFGLLGASSAALAMRIEGVPLPTAQHLVIAYPGDRIRVKAKGVFSVAWDRPRPDKDAKRWNEDGMLIPASAIETFAPNEAERIYVDRGLAEMRIVSVIDDNTHQPPSLEFPINDGDILTVEGWKRPDGSLVQFRAVLPEGRALRVEPLQPGDTFSMDIRPRINPQE